MAADTYYAYHLRFPNGLYVGRSGYNEEYVGGRDLPPSDTLKAALQVCAIRLFGETECANDSFLAGFRISSAFPFVGSTRFFPKPLTGIQKRTDHSADGKKQAGIDAKKWKRVKYIAEDLFARILAGKLLEDTDVQSHWFQGSYLINGEQTSSGLKFSEMETRTRLRSVDYKGRWWHDPDSSSPDPYHVERTLYHPEAGLWFLAHYVDGVAKARVEAALRLLADEGLGTDRSVGYGYFEWVGGEPKPIDLPAPTQANAWLNLGLLCPEDDAQSGVDWASSAFDLEKRGGYITETSVMGARAWRKRTVWMLREGSVLCPSLAGYQPKGRCHNLQPEILNNQPGAHPVFRCGNPLLLPISLPV